MGDPPTPNTHWVGVYGKGRGPRFKRRRSTHATCHSAARHDACVANPNALAAAADQPADDPVLLLLLLSLRAWAGQLSFFPFLIFSHSFLTVSFDMRVCVCCRL